MFEKVKKKKLNVTTSKELSDVINALLGNVAKVMNMTFKH